MKRLYYFQPVVEMGMMGSAEFVVRVEGSSIHEAESRKDEEYESLSDKVMILERKTLVDRIDGTDVGITFEKHKYGNDQDTTPSPKLQSVVMVEEQAIIEREVLVDEYRVDLPAHSQLQHVDGDGEDVVEVPVDHVVHSFITTELRTSMEVLIEPADNLAAKSPRNEGRYATMEIWRQINAIRLIIGYGGDRQESTVEELQALYGFMGMEPPATIKPHEQFANANNMLRLLKSVVGILNYVL